MTHAKRVPHRLIEGDLGVVNAARVSFGKTRERFLPKDDPDIPKGENSDEGLVNFLARNHHWSPFAHPQICFRVIFSMLDYVRYALERPIGMRIVQDQGDTKYVFLSGSLYSFAKNLKALPEHAQTVVSDALFEEFPYSAKALDVPYPKRDAVKSAWGASRIFPEATISTGDDQRHLLTETFRISAPIYVARQLVKHQVDLVWNEESRRYVDREPDCQLINEWSKRPEGSIKQGAGEPFDRERQFLLKHAEGRSVSHAVRTYQELLGQGAAPEQARSILPQNMLVEWYWTGTLDAWARVCRERLDSHAQKETRPVAADIDRELQFLYGDIWTFAKEAEARDE